MPVEISFKHKIEKRGMQSIPQPSEANMSTPRPTVDVEVNDCTNEMYKERKRIMMKHVHASHEMRRVVNTYRDYQIKLIIKNSSCSIKAAKEKSEDPYPYNSTFIFYCVGKGGSV
jgi:hypothetical protein